MIDQLLRDIGLSTKEAEMYINLLRNGSQSISYLAKRLQMNRGTAYVILHQLLEKGLAKKHSRKGVQYFSPLDPHSLVDYLDAQKTAIESNKKKVEAMMSQLVAITNPLTTKPKIEFYDGAKGALNALLKTLESNEKNIKAFISLPDLIDFVGIDLVEEYEKKRIKHKFKLQVIRTQEKDKDAINIDSRAKHHTSSKIEKREVRYAATDLAFPMTMFLFDDNVIFISSKRENFAVSIKSTELVQMLKKLFDLLWNSINKDTIKVGILHSLSRPMATLERSLVDAELMAIDEINTSGGILGKQIEPIVVDGASDPNTFAKETERLITKEGVCSIFGGYISITRKPMIPIVEKHNHVLWYPTQYEGLESSKNVIYVGSSSTEKFRYCIDWAKEKIGSTFYLVGTEDLYPRASFEIIKDLIKDAGGSVAGEQYQKLQKSNYTNIVKDVVRKKPESIICIINNETKSVFLKEIQAQNITAKDIPIIFMGATEEEFSTIGFQSLSGNYAVLNYLQHQNNPQNKAFIERVKSRYGKHHQVGDGMFSSYASVYLFAEAVKKAGSTKTEEILKAAAGISCSTPDGKIAIDRDNLHAYRKVRICKIEASGSLKIIKETKTPIRPTPYPHSRSVEQWGTFLKKIYKEWGNKWSS